MQIIDRFKQSLQGGPEGQGGEGAEENSQAVSSEQCTVGSERLDCTLSTVHFPRLPCTPAPLLRWTPEALARLERIPSFVRGMAQKAIEEQARKRGMEEITAELMAAVGSQRMPAAARRAIGLSREAPEAQEAPVPSLQAELVVPEASRVWTPEALERLNQVHEGLLREIIRERIELYAQKKGETRITVELMEAKYGEWRERGGHWSRELPWSPEAQERVDKAPAFVRGTIIRELEQYARERGRPEVTLELIEEARSTRWQARQMYHAHRT